MAKPDGPRKVLLLHGIWMPGVSMAWLGARLTAAGFETEVFAYAGAGGGPEATLPRLVERLRREPVHVLAHSLGGLITLTALREHPGLPVRRVVCLGSPLCGSQTARNLAASPWTRPLLGRSAPMLAGGLAGWDGPAQVGVVAGDVAHGLGRLFARFDGDSDGTVGLEETRLPGLADHCTVHSSHTGLVFSPAAVRQAAHFLRHGRFEHAAEPPAV